MQILDANELLATAQARTGVTSLGPEDFREGFEVLIEAINESGLIREDRVDHLRERLLNFLMNRAWFAKDLAENPEIEAENIGRPVIIASLPRTGSTKLQRIMGATDDFQTLRLWSVSKFARIPGLPNGGKAERIRQTQEYEKWMYEVSPEIAKWHPVHTEEPEEDCFLLESTFRDMISYGITGAPGFLEWLIKADRQPAIDYFVSVIKYLQWQDPEARHKPWLFKYPDHLGDEERLCRTYEKPKFIITHRDPAKCVPSVTQTMMAVRRLYSDVDTTQHLASAMLRAGADQTLRHIKWRDSHPNAEVLDLSFGEVTQDGIGTLRKIYEFLDMDFSETSLANAHAWETRNPREKHGRTSYSADEVNRTDEEIREAFSAYVDRFSAYME